MSYMDCCDWDRCTRCGLCLARCRVLEMSEYEARKEIRLLLAGEKAPKVFSRCTLCFNCNQYCPEGLRPHELILQRILVARGERIPALIPYLMNGLPGANFFHDLYAALDREEQGVLSRWTQPPPVCEEFLFVGCIGRLSCLDLENSRVLSSLPKFGPPDLCCGELHYRAGSWNAFADRAEATLERLSALKAKRMVCYCGSCAAFFGRILPKVYGKSLPFKTISLYEWLWEKVEGKSLTVKNPLSFTAAIHESCYATELGPDFSEALRGLYESAGATCMELDHNGNRNLSCGAVSVARNSNIFKSLLPAQTRKFKEIKCAGVREVALNCPGCFITMSFTSRLHGVKLRYMPELLLSALGDEVTRPLAGRMGLILRAGAKRWRLLLQKTDPGILSAMNP